MKGTYESSAGGWTQNPLRALTGAPVFEYWSIEETQSVDDVWARFKAADDLDYLLGAGTDGNDSGTNQCGIVAGHAYTMIAVFELKTGSTVDHKMYMFRNPWDITYFKLNWNHKDTDWTEDYIS